MSEWKEYTGAPEQIEEIANPGTDVLCRYQNGTERFKSEMFIGDWKHKFLTEYLICNPNPLADMICQQARTGQEVWVLEPIVGTEDHPLWPRLLAEGINRENVGTAILEKGIFCQYSTRTPYWHIPDTQYSFTRIGGYRANK